MSVSVALLSPCLNIKRQSFFSTCDVKFYLNQNIKAFQAKDLSLYASFCRNHLEWTLQLFNLHIHIFTHIGVVRLNRRSTDQLVFIME